MVIDAWVIGLDAWSTMSETHTVKFTFPDGEVQEHDVPYPLLRIVKLIQRRDYTFDEMPATVPVVLFRLVRFADSTGREWIEYHVDSVEQL